MKSINTSRQKLSGNEAFYISGIDIDDMKNRMGIVVYSLDAWYFSDETAQMNFKGSF